MHFKSIISTIFALSLAILLTNGCSVSYSLTGSNIDYNTVKTIKIDEFTNQATLVYPTLAQIMSERMRDVYTRNTKLQFTEREPDIEIQGSIVNYSLSQQAVRSDGYASESRLTLGVRVQYRNNKNLAENKELTLSAYRDFSNQFMLSDVQDQLVQELVEDIVDQIFNGTMSNW